MMWLYLNLRRITFLHLLLLLGSTLDHEWSLVQIIRVIVHPLLSLSLSQTDAERVVLGSWRECLWDDPSVVAMPVTRKPLPPSAVSRWPFHDSGMGFDVPLLIITCPLASTGQWP
jgi:hypothetical protein